MKVEIQTRVEQNGPAVRITAAETCFSPAHLDERIHALRVARNWLEKELEKGKTK